ncbi:MAG: DUF1579 family protein [Gammaproteobacteria bacterium]
MKKFTVGAAVLMFAMSACAGHHEEGEQAQAVSVEEQAMMAAMQAAATPGEPHARLADSAGSFDAAMTIWTGPDSEPMHSTMTVERRMDLAGRVLVEDWTGSVMGAPFVGHSRTGYDNVTKRYWSTWTDNMSTGLLVMYGQWDTATETLQFEGKNVNPATGAAYTLRSEGSHPAADTELMTMYEDHGQGEYKAMSFTLKRR